MREDNDHALGDESKSHQCLEENREDAGLKIPENEKNNVCELFYDTRSGDDWDIENEGKKIRDTCHDCAANVGDSPEKVDPVFYMDKNVTACDLPEIVVCYKENTYHVVKDICVDEGVKFLLDKKDSVMSSSNSNQCGSEEVVKVDRVNVIPLETKSSEDRNIKVGVPEFCNDHKRDRDGEESSGEDFADAEGSSNYNQEDLSVTTHALNPTEMSLEVESKENSKGEVAIPSEIVLTESLTLEDILSREDEQNSLNRGIGEHSHPQLQEQDKEKRSLETRGVETELKQAEEKLSSENNSYEEDKLSSSRFGETSFSAAEADSVSGHITYSGPIVYSGSLSVRSDASTTSGRSFAFPILQSEWNSSPVRMAKADKRRQKGGWRHTLLCCRFS